jgi:hypothetical protein
MGLPVLALMMTVGPALAASGGQASLSGARASTAAFHTLSAAQAAGYTVEVADLAGITCIEDPGMSGTMGVHYLNLDLSPELVDSTVAGSVEATTPEILVYEPGPDGQLQLVALEYLVLWANWDPYHAERPSLFGREFDLTLAGNRYGLPDFYSLHAWIWRPNPIDIFAAFNPTVSCG